MADTKDDIRSAKPEKFYGLNFKRWQKQMKFWLTTLGLISVLETPNCDKQIVTNGSGTGTETSTATPTPTPTSSSSPKSIKELDYFCLNRILSALSDTLYDIYCDFDSAKDLWNALESEYGYDDVGVPKGRKDGRISKAIETRQLPSPTFNISQLQQSFSQRGLSMHDLATLSGGHTLGFSHCSSFQNRIHNFNAKHDVDPSMKPSFAASLKNVCPMHNKVRSAGATLDSSVATFDNMYYKLLVQGKGLFSSDQALLNQEQTKELVSRFAYSKEEFEKAFAKSMIKMSSISGGQEVRLNCRVVN